MRSHRTPRRGARRRRGAQAKRREATLNLEVKRLQSEVRLERSRVQSQELQLESNRKAISEAADTLARKRQKKRK